MQLVGATAESPVHPVGKSYAMNIAVFTENEEILISVWYGSIIQLDKLEFVENEDWL